MNALNKQHIVFTTFNDIRQICSPLKHMGISGFVYKKIYNDGSYIDLATDNVWADVYYQKFYSEDYKVPEIQEHHFFANNISLWSLNPQNTIWRDANDYCNHKNGISLYEHDKNFKEIFCYYSDDGSSKTDDFYINNLDLLSHFSTYFKEKATDLIIQGDQNRLLTPKKYQTTPIQKQPPVTAEELKAFWQMTRLDKIPVGNNRHISQRELEVLYWLSQGKTAEMISMILTISQRTIKAHIRNLKDKLEVENQFQLGVAFNKLNLSIQL